MVSFVTKENRTTKVIWILFWETITLVNKNVKNLGYFKKTWGAACLFSSWVHFKLGWLVRSHIKPDESWSEVRNKFRWEILDYKCLKWYSVEEELGLSLLYFSTLRHHISSHYCSEPLKYFYVTQLTFPFTIQNAQKNRLSLVPIMVFDIYPSLGFQHFYLKQCALAKWNWFIITDVSFKGILSKGYPRGWSISILYSKCNGIKQNSCKWCE